MTDQEYLPRAERRAVGKLLRGIVPRASHAAWTPAVDRPDPVEVLIESNAGRMPELVPLRFGRMLQSPFAFFRGAAAIMAADLATTPTTGLRVQACGDCHLLNFGAFATPERKVVFDINDFDETLPAPWEWDVKRLAASFILAGRNSRFAESECRDAAQEAVRSYRQYMSQFAEMRVLEVWYTLLEANTLREMTADPQMRAFREKRLKKALSRTVHEHDFPKLTERNGDLPRIKDDPPFIFHTSALNYDESKDNIEEALRFYRETLPDDRRELFDRYRLVDIAIKVVGVGSVGTVCGIGLFLAEDDDPIFLQVKQARPSVLEPYAGKSVYKNHGQRVVQGQKLTQSASDIFLGWTMGRLGRHFYLRQLRDVKIKTMLEVFDPEHLCEYGTACGWALARAHARSGDAAKISGYLGSGTNFDEAVADFAVAYADKSEEDHAALVAAVRAGKVEAVSDPS